MRAPNDSLQNFLEEAPLMSGLLSKFNNFQLQSPLNTMQSELSSEEPVNNDGYNNYQSNAETADNLNYQKLDRRPQPQFYQQYDYLRNNQRNEKPGEASDAWVLFPNHVSSQSKLFLHNNKPQNDVDYFLASNTNPILETPEDSASKEQFDL